MSVGAQTPNRRDRRAPAPPVTLATEQMPLRSVSRPPQPYLRWIGGKRRIASRLRRFVPRDYHSRTYHEPFLGAASLFLALEPQTAHLSDLNNPLIESFRCVRARPGLVARYIAQHAALNSEAYYYKIRHQFNHITRFSYAQAGRFIYLNRTCFNGIFRVNRQGRFNVPYGRRGHPTFPNKLHLRRVSDAMQKATLSTLPYGEALTRARAGDFVYLDPPYPPLNGTSYFRHYTADRFNGADQSALAATTRRLTKRGCLVMMSNADTSEVRELYRGMFMTALPVVRSVSCKKVKHIVSELVITSYGPSDMLGS